MIILHRITSFTLAVLLGTGFGFLIYMPKYGGLAVLLMAVFLLLLTGRMLKWEFKKVPFWIFWGTPLFYLLSSLSIFLFLELDILKLLLAFTVVFGIWLYEENLFAFYHLPSTYQAYALEYLSLVIYVLSAFFFASGAYAAQLFVQLPIWIPLVVIFWTVLFVTTGVFWVSKVTQNISTRYAFSGAIIMSEFFAVLSFLPTSYLTKASVFAVFLYLFLGLSRANVLDKLSKLVLKRYILTSTIFLFIILATAQWI